VVDTAAVRLTNLVKTYGHVTAIDDVSVQIRRGEFFSLLGPSGCGKTTTLRAIAGLAPVDNGTIEIFGRDVTELPPNKRNIGLVFQNYALFPHMTVAQNVAFGLRMRRVSRVEIPRRVRAALELVRLTGTEGRFPRQLSGGQQQRVALARAIVIEPQLLLLDEPLSNLDAKLRKSMQVELRALQKRLGITAIYVTHDQEEALTLSDRVAVMDSGRISQCATPIEIYRQPANRFVAEFIGRVNLLHGRLGRRDGRVLFEVSDGMAFRVPQALAAAAGASNALNLVLRPENVQLDPSGERHADGVSLTGRIIQAVYTGAVTDYVVETSNGLRLLAEQQNTLGRPRHREGDTVQVYVEPDALYSVPDS
jgi:putative spermidine/putrescine transport system ATP-binding protein